jgi:Bacterial Ig-like domain
MLICSSYELAEEVLLCEPWNSGGIAVVLMNMRTRLIVSLLVVCGALTLVSLAHAGTYTVLGCRVSPGDAAPTGAAAPMSGWNVDLDGQSSSTLEYWQDGCPSASFLFMTANSSHPDGSYASETFSAPPGTTISAYTFWRAVRLAVSDGYYYQAWSLSGGTWTRVEGCAGAGQCGTYGNYETPTATVNHFSVHAPNDTTEVRLELYCGKSGGCPAAQPNADSIWLWSTAVALEDDSAPQFAGAPSGPLVSGGVLSGVEPVSIGATDQGSGVYQAELEVDGQIAQSQVLDNSTGTCQTPFTAVVPCPLSASGTLDFNTAQLSDGTHSLEVRVTDAAGNTAVWGPVTITTVNSPCSPLPAAGGMTMQSALPSRSHKRGARTRWVRQLTIGYGSRPTVRGELTDASGAPVPGAAVCVAAQDDYAGASLRPVATIATNASGRFSYRLHRGPSRTVSFIHRVPSGAISSSVAVHVHVPVKVHVIARRLVNGQVMTWKGRLPGPIPNGLIALMQVWRGGNIWQSIGNHPVSVARNGKWVGRYRFQFTTGVQHYLFRLSVPRQSQYPYAAGTSKPFTVVVTG